MTTDADRTDAHDPTLEQVKDGPWTAGYRITCACGWHTAPHPRPGLAAREHYDHRLEHLATTKESTA